MSLPSPPARSRRSRAAAAVPVGLVVLFASVLGSSAAAAAPAAEPVTIELDPARLGVLLFPVENYAALLEPASAEATTALLAAGVTPQPFGGPGARADGDRGPASAPGGVRAQQAAEALAAADVLADADPFEPAPVAVEHGGTAVVQLPAWLDASAADVVLEMYPSFDAETPTRTYSTDAVAPDTLTVTDLGAGALRVDLPADDGASGPYALLAVDGLTVADERIELLLPPAYVLEFTGTGVAEQTVQPSVLALAAPTCDAPPEENCPAIEVAPGTPVTFTVPPASLLRAVGAGALDPFTLEMLHDEDLEPSEDDFVTPTDDPAAVSVATPYEATVTLPADLRSGRYLAVLTQGDPATAAVSTFFELEVPAPVNAGLRSDTGWVEPRAAAAGGSGPAVALGAGLLAVSAAGTAVALRLRRRGAGAPR